MQIFPRAGRWVTFFFFFWTFAGATGGFFLELGARNTGPRGAARVCKQRRKEGRASKTEQARRSKINYKIEYKMQSTMEHQLGALAAVQVQQRAQLARDKRCAMADGAGALQQAFFIYFLFFFILTGKQAVVGSLVVAGWLVAASSASAAWFHENEERLYCHCRLQLKAKEILGTGSR